MASKKLIESVGIPVEIVSRGGNGGYRVSGSLPGITENQAGSFLLMHAGDAASAPDFQPALRVLVAVVSETEGERIVVDAGCKAISGERGLPSVKGIDGMRLKALQAEHAPIELLDPRVHFEVGDTIDLAVRYHDGTVHLHQQMYGVRKNVVEEVLAIE